MTNTFVYEELDLDSRSFRIIRLCRGDKGPIECKLMHAYVGDDENGMEYEALSYTWGDLAKPCSIKVNGQMMHITKNLSEVLEHLRLEHEDRFLWIDALCINQDDYRERGHQVRQMASVYERARQVIFWLGTATEESNRAFHIMQRFEKEMLNHSCNNWQPSDERWQFLWSNVTLQEQAKNSRSGDATDQSSYMTLLERDWFQRIWIVQEVAKARSARVACGTESVSARVFALFPQVLKVQPSPQCQAVLDIMPGPSRKFSWWLANQDLETLLRKFEDSKASDPRDMVYALLGISSNAHDAKALNPDYTKTLEELTRVTVAFLLKLEGVGISSSCLPEWSLGQYFITFDRLDKLRYDILTVAFGESNGATNVTVRDGFPKIEFLHRPWRTKQHMTHRVLSHKGWGLLLDTDQASVETLDDLTKQGTILPPLAWAAQSGSTDMVEYLLASGIADEQSTSSGNTALALAAEQGHEGVVQLLLSWQDVVVDSRNHEGQTPLHLAVWRYHTTIATMLLETGRADVNAMDAHGRTPLGATPSIVTQYGYKLRGYGSQMHESMVKLLLALKHVDVNVQDARGLTPLAVAAQRGDTSLVEALLGLYRVHANVRDESGRTPPHMAAEQGHDPTVRVLLDPHELGVDSKDNHDFNPLAAAIRHCRVSDVNTLLELDQVEINWPISDWMSPQGYRHPLMLALRRGNKDIIKMLLKSPRVNMVRIDLPLLMRKSPWLAQDPEISGLLEVFVRRMDATEKVDTTEETHIGAGT